MCHHTALCIRLFSVSEMHIKLRDAQFNRNVFRYDTHVGSCVRTTNLIRTSSACLFILRHNAVRQAEFHSNMAICTHS
jgi:hypothetical protein